LQPSCSTLLVRERDVKREHTAVALMVIEVFMVPSGSRQKRSHIAEMADQDPDFPTRRRGMVVVAGLGRRSKATDRPV
jgi:hypothetical protein